MRSEWRDCTLGGFVRLQRGHDLTASEQLPGTVPVMGSAGPNGTHAEARAKGPGVVIGRSGASIGRVHYSAIDYWPHNTCLYVTDFLGNHPRFAYYLLQTLDLAGYNSGSAQPSLNRNYIYGMKIRVPARDEQNLIVETLQAFDDRVDLLRQTNATLESIAQALFKSWFIDFDPVRAKAEGSEPEGMDAATAALFPDALEGFNRPKGWLAKPLYEVAAFVNGAAYKAFQPNTDGRGLPIIKIAELKNGITAQTAYSDVQMPEKYRIEDGDLLFSWSGNPDTSIDTFIWAGGQAWLNQHIFRVVPHFSDERWFLFLLHRYLRPVFAEIARNKQTTGLGHVTVSDLKRLAVVVPPRDVLNDFNKLVSPMLEAMQTNVFKSKGLVELRDTLLPRFISGKLRLHEVHKHLEAAAA